MTDASGNTYIADDFNCDVRKVAPDGTISRFAGTGSCGFTGNGGPATSAMLNDADGVAVDAAGNVYVADSINNEIRVVSPAGIINDFAGSPTGASGYTGDHGQATAATLNYPWDVEVDRSGDVFISDGNNHVVREVNAQGIITTVAGNGTAGNSGDNGPATSAQLHFPSGLFVDNTGNLLISDESAHVVREVNTSGIITTVAGNGNGGTTGDGGPATSAELEQPYGVVEDNAGNLYIGDYQGPSVRFVNAATGKITTYAGTSGTFGSSTGNGGPASAALLKGPSQVWLDPSGNLLINDYRDNTIRKVTLASPTGLGYWFAASDGGVFNYGTTRASSGRGRAAAEQAHRRDGGHPRRQGLLAGGLRRRHLQLRRRRLLRLRRVPPAQQAHRRHGPDPRRQGVLAGGLGRRDLQLRRRRVLRLPGWPAPQQAHRRPGCHSHRQGLLAGGVRRRHLQLWRRPVPWLGRLPPAQQAGGGPGGHPGRGRLLAGGVRRRRLQLRRRPVPRLGRLPPAQQAGGGPGGHPGRHGLLAGGVRRRHLQLRRRRLLRLDREHPPQPARGGDGAGWACRAGPLADGSGRA